MGIGHGLMGKNGDLRHEPHTDHGHEGVLFRDIGPPKTTKVNVIQRIIIKRYKVHATPNKRVQAPGSRHIRE